MPPAPLHLLHLPLAFTRGFPPPGAEGRTCWCSKVLAGGGSWDAGAGRVDLVPAPRQYPRREMDITHGAIQPFTHD